VSDDKRPTRCLPFFAGTHDGVSHLWQFTYLDAIEVVPGVDRCEPGAEPLSAKTRCGNEWPAEDVFDPGAPLCEHCRLGAIEDLRLVPDLKDSGAIQTFTKP